MNIRSAEKNFLFALMLAITALPVYAGDDQYVLEESTYKVLTRAREEMNAGENLTALARMQKLLPDITDKTYDTAVVQQTLGYIYYALENFDKALTSFIASVESGALPKEVTHDLYFTIAQLATYRESYSTALDYLKKWFADEPVPAADAHLLAANIFLQTDNYNSAIPHLKDAINKSDKPSRSWYEMLLVAYIQTNKLNSAAALLENMIVLYPAEKRFWLHLVSIYQQLEQDRKALAISELAYTRGLLNADEILTLAKNYLYLDMPYEAGVLIADEMEKGVLEQNTEHLKLLANSWLSAQEYDRAVDILAQLSNREPEEPEHAFRMAQLLLEQQQWKPALAALQKVVKTDDFKKIGEAWLMLGMAQYELKEKQASLASFNKALKHKSSQEQARWWVLQISEELDEETADS